MLLVIGSLSLEGLVGAGSDTLLELLGESMGYTGVGTVGGIYEIGAVQFLKIFCLLSIIDLFC